MTVSQAISQITPPNEAARAQAQARWNALAKPLGSLGLLEEQLSAIAALTGSPEISLDRPVLLVYCGDNGVVAQGVSQSGPEVTAAVAMALGRGESTVCHMAAVPGCQVIPVDVGMLDFPGGPGILNRRVRSGTGDITQGPAMEQRECLRAMEVGMELVYEAKRKGSHIVLTGEMGIGNTTTSSALVSVLLGLPPEQVTGRGAGLSDEGLVRKRQAIRQAIEQNKPSSQDPIDVLTKVGGLELAALCGTFLGGALYGVPILMDGFISSAAALCALEVTQGWPMASMVSLKPWRSSALRMDSALVPKSRTPYLSRVPSSARAMARFNPVCPPRVGSTASGRSISMIWVTEAVFKGSIYT